ncbi:hypothetical protein H1Q58_09640 [Planococcus maritimus]|uniref:Uncharacterized protein n=1 Tax=Planococcus maritimus TaxID=192421 RepID=A0A7D7RD51_PLAMR|nr:hypothetical protein [Planococcus maritimus]QMT16240.1 hypothetical protein H1Q58_09640 [Planococcus maritimus]
MIEVISSLFSNFGIPGVIIALIFFFLKNNPITSISSSVIEMKLATKEKRFYVRAVKDILWIVTYTMFFLGITGTFFMNKDLYYFSIFITIFLVSIVTFFWIVTLDAKNKTFSDITSKRNVRQKWIIFILLLLSFLSFFVLPAYYIGTQLQSNILESTFSVVEKYAIFTVVAIIYLFISIVLHFMVVDTYLNFLELKGKNKYTLTVVVRKEKWYIFHPIEKEVYLLGNKEALNECTRFSFIERKQRLEEIVEIEN